ncbi:hypothetical protein ACFXKW_38050 [Streptomyces sp. NPDC059193]|uniref:hypothetical protein n=1 Tax=Streptomyces sp. NPDC059193 TaxID=3346763 RepID=UPI00367E5CE9
MGHIKPQRTQRDRRRTEGLGVGAPPGAVEETARLKAAWDRAIDTGLMPEGNEVNWRALPTGDLISDAIGGDGQMLVDGQELTAEWAAELRRTKPVFAGLVDVFVETARGWTRLSEMGPCPHATCDCPS